MEMNELEFSTFLERYTDSLSKTTTAEFDPFNQSEAYRIDYAIFCRSITEAHTPFYRFLSKQNSSGSMESLYSLMEDKANYFSLLRAVANMQNSIGCTHSGWSHAQSYFKYRKKNIHLFPIDIYVIDRSFYVYANNSSDTTIHKHDEVLKINGEKPFQIMLKLRQHMNREGNCARNDVIDIEQYFSSAFSNFIDNTKKFNLVLKNEAGEERNVTLKALLKSEIDKNRATRNRKVFYSQKSLELEIMPEQKAACYTIRSFNNDQIARSGQDFNTFTEEVFYELITNGVENLIIDLRGNSGGWTGNGAELFSYFISDSLDYIKSVKANKYKGFSFEPIMLQNPGYLDSFDIKMHEDGLYYWENYPSLTVHPNADYNFSGQVYILTDGMTRSCSNVFSVMMDQHTKAKFVGSETVGSYCGSGGMVTTIELPFSKLKVNFSTAEYTYAVDESNCTVGVIPDMVIKTTRIDDSDKVMDHIMEVLNAQNKE